MPIKISRASYSNMIIAIIIALPCLFASITKSQFAAEQSPISAIQLPSIEFGKTRICSYNVHMFKHPVTRKSSVQEMVLFLRKMNCDVLAMQEYVTPKEQLWTDFIKGMGYYYAETQNISVTAAILPVITRRAQVLLTKSPQRIIRPLILPHGNHPITKNYRNALQVTICIAKDKCVTITNVHLSHGSCTQLRKQQLEYILDVNGTTQNRMIIGDFNDSSMHIAPLLNSKGYSLLPGRKDNIGDRRTNWKEQHVDQMYANYYTNEKVKVVSSDLSDHLLIYCDVDIPSISPIKT
jgi:endonuclease/exonuclease/phosphatase family metal-dependent hydrolase